MNGGFKGILKFSNVVKRLYCLINPIKLYVVMCDGNIYKYHNNCKFLYLSFSP